MRSLALAAALLSLYAIAPGLILGWFLDLRGARLLALAPPLSFSVVAAATAITAVLPALGWGPATVGLSVALLSLGAIGAKAAWRAVSARIETSALPSDHTPSPSPSQAEPTGSRAGSVTGRIGPLRHAAGLTAAALLISVALWGWLLHRILPAADSFSQTYDNVFHLSTIRFIHDSGLASPLLPIGLGDGTPGSHVYPTLWHAFTALAMPVAGDVAVATNAALLIVCGLLWPASLITLLLALTDPRPGTLLATGAVAAAIPAFPLLTISWGVLYPNTVGLALVPAALGGMLTAAGMAGRDRGPRFPIGLAGLLLMPATFLGHPNAFVLVLLFLAPALVAAAVRYWRGPGRTLSTSARAVVITAQVLVAVLVFMAWLFIRPEYNAWPPISSKLPALADGLLLSLPGSPATFVVAALVAVGLVASLRDPSRRWICAAWFIALALWVVTASFAEGPTRTLLTETFYSDPPRLMAALGVIAAPLAMLGINELLALVPRVARAAVLPSSGAAGVVVLVIPTVVLILLTQGGPALRHGVDAARGTYEFAPTMCEQGDRSCLVTADERELLRRLPDLVEPGVGLLTIPTNGSSLAYALEGLPVAWTYIAEPPRPALLVLDRQLDQAPAGDAAICAAADSLGIGYVLDFGPQNVSGDMEDHPGLDALETASSVEPVDAVGTTALYRLRGCTPAG